MPMPSTCKEVSKNQSLIYNPSLGYKRKDKAFVVEKLFKESCPSRAKHHGISPHLSGEVRRLMTTTLKPSKRDLLAHEPHKACDCQNSKMTPQ